MKYLFFFLIFSGLVLAQPSHYEWHGEFMSDWYGAGVPTATQTLGASSIEWATFHANATNTGNDNFVVEWDGGYNRWYNTSIDLNSIFSLTFQGGGNPSDSKLNTAAVNGEYYTLRIDGRAYGNRNAIVMHTTNAPVSIGTPTLTQVDASSPLIINITPSATPSSGENIFVRYTTDSWVSFSNSHIIQASGSGTTWTASISDGGAPSNSTHFYYVFTSTLALATLQAFPSDVNINLATLAVNNNSGSNFVLPVELTSFSALKVGTSVNLKWNTATEVNNSGFQIERKKSTETSWSNIGFINGAGNSNSPKNYSFSDKSNLSGSYQYRLKQIDFGGQYEYSKSIEVTINSMPKGYVFSQNYPNPFNPSTGIKFGFEHNTKASLKIYNAIGSEVAVLFNDVAEAGRVYDMNFNGANLPSGTYFYKLSSPNKEEVKKMTLLK